MDLYVLPKKSIEDKITAYSKITVSNNSKFSRRQVLLGYTFYTQKNLQFALEKSFIEEVDVQIEISRIFQNITSVKTAKGDYSNKLMSGLNRDCLLFIIILSASTFISLLVLFKSKNLSENGFQNIILFNSLMLFFALYLFVLYN